MCNELYTIALHSAAATAARAAAARRHTNFVGKDDRYCMKLSLQHRTQYTTPCHQGDRRANAAAAAAASRHQETR